jgi:hypothetical protein
MLFVTGTPNPAAATAASSSVGGIFTVGESSTSAIRRTGPDLTQSRAPGYDGSPGGRVPTLPRGRRRATERLLPSITELVGWHGHRSTRRYTVASAALDDGLRPSDWSRTADSQPVPASHPPAPPTTFAYSPGSTCTAAMRCVPRVAQHATAAPQEQQPRSPA